LYIFIVAEKKATYGYGYPRNFICAELNNSVNFTSRGYYYYNGGYVDVGSPSNLAINTVCINSSVNTSGQQLTSNNISAGNKFTACYVTNNTEASNAPTTTKKLTDASWSMSDFYLQAVSTLSQQGYWVNSGIKLADRPITFSSMSGSSITVSSVRSDMSYYTTLYESYSSDSNYRSKTSYPYLYGSFYLSYTSATYKSLIGASNDNYAPELVCFFMLKR